MSDGLDEVARAEALLGTAEAGIRKLIQQCLEQNRYAMVAVLAELADGVASVRRRTAADVDNGDSLRGTGRAWPQLGAAPRPATPEAQSGARGKLRSQLASTYPRFEREGDRLVKIGWSKKDDREYEHKAPRSAVVAVCGALAKRGKRAPTITMNALLPVADAEEQEVPSYQVYLVVAWLRQLGVVERTGKDGYAVNAAQLAPEIIDATWSSLPRYEANV